MFHTFSKKKQNNSATGITQHIAGLNIKQRIVIRQQICKGDIQNIQSDDDASAV